MRSGAKNFNSIGKTDWKDPHEVADAIKFILAQRHLKADLEARTARNCAFLEGRQLLDWNPDQRRMSLPERYRRDDDWLIFNILKPIVKAKASKLSRVDPVWKVPAFSSDESDQMVARFSNELLTWYYKHGLRVPELIPKLLNWLETSPVAFLEPAWDPMAGDEIDLTLDDFLRDSPKAPDNASADVASQFDGQAKQMMGEDLSAYRGLLGYNQTDPHGVQQPVKQYTGDVALRIRSIFKTMWYPFLIEEWDQMRAYIVSEVMTPEEISHRYRLPIDEVMQEVNSAEGREYFEKTTGGYSSPWIAEPTPTDGFDNGVVVHQFYADTILAPSEGCSAVLIGNGDKVIRLGPLGNAMKKLAIIPISASPDNLHAWGTCTIDDSISAQMELNESRTQLSRWRRRKTKPKVIKDVNDQGDTTALEDEDSVYECDMSKRPQILSEPTAGMEEGETVAFCMRYVHDTIGVADVSMGHTGDRNDPSGRAILALKASVDERLQTLGKDLNHAFTKAGEFILAELQQKATANRMTPIIGDRNQHEFRLWSAADLRPGVWERNPRKAAAVVVDAFSTLPSSPAELQQLVMTLFEMKVLRPGEHDRIITNIFGLDDVQSVLDRGRSGRDHAEMQVLAWKRGEPGYPIRATDDHEEAIPIISDFVNSDEYLSIAGQNPQLGLLIQQRLDQHKQAKFDVLAEEQMAVQFAQMRAAAKFTQKAVAANMPGAAAHFLALSGGVTGPIDEAEPSAGKPNQRQQPRNSENESSNGRSGLKPNSARSEHGPTITAQESQGGPSDG